jgi:hypothetical protein
MTKTSADRKTFNEAAAELQSALIEFILRTFPCMTRLLRRLTRLIVKLGLGTVEARRHD